MSTRDVLIIAVAWIAAGAHFLGRRKRHNRRERKNDEWIRSIKSLYGSSRGSDSGSGVPDCRGSVTGDDDTIMGGSE